MRKGSDRGWNPCVAGALTGLLAVLSAWATTARMGRTSFEKKRL